MPLRVPQSSRSGAWACCWSAGDPSSQKPWSGPCLAPSSLPLGVPEVGAHVGLAWWAKFRYIHPVLWIQRVVAGMLGPMLGSMTHFLDQSGGSAWFMAFFFSGDVSLWRIQVPWNGTSSPKFYPTGLAEVLLHQSVESEKDPAWLPGKMLSTALAIMITSPVSDGIPSHAEHETSFKHKLLHDWHDWTNQVFSALERRRIQASIHGSPQRPETTRASLQGNDSLEMEGIMTIWSSFTFVLGSLVTPTRLRWWDHVELLAV